jgi:arylsulfatase A-like enzyme
VYVRLVKQRWYGGALRELLRFNWRPFDTYQAHSEKPAVSVTAEFIDWQASVRRPYFAMLNYMEAHSGVAFPTRAMFGAGAKRQDEYDGAIWWLDHELRALISHLQQRGELEQTIIIVTSDHGEQFGEHGLNGHGNSLYSLELHVPLVMYAPSRLPGGVRISRAVSLRDIARTVQELTNVQAEVLPGSSLAALATSPQTETSPVIAQLSRSHNHPPRQPLYWGDMISVFDDSVHVIRDGRGTIQAYAYRSDVGEKKNLAQDPAHRAMAVQRLEDTIRRGLGQLPY